jgi:ankyrin repeat protein
LLEHHADTETRNDYGMRELHDATDYEHPEAVRTLLEYEARNNIRDEVGNTPLHAATQSGNERAVRLLLENSADIATRNNFEAEHWISQFKTRTMKWCRRS